MKLLTCPVNGMRPISEFVCWGEVRPEPPDMCSDETWADYVFNRNGAPGTKTEWWCHTPSNTWFLAMRDTEADHVSRTWMPGDPQ
jgi:sarcosine oxidase subunit delta